MTDIVKSKLSELAQEINNAHQQANEAFKHSLNHAVFAGEKLINAKSACGHGNWLEWHTNNIHHSEDTSHNYMNIYRNKKLLLANSDKIRNLSVSAALKLIAGGTPMLQSMSNEWYTPKEYIDAVREVLGDIELDPATCFEAQKIVEATDYFTEEDDGLSRPWYGKVFLNPPYGKLGPAFVDKLMKELKNTVSEAILLVNANATETNWFQPCFDGILCFTDHRIDFGSPDEVKNSSTHGSVFIYFGKNNKLFNERFRKFGNVVIRYE